MGLQWGDVELETGKVRVERSVEKTRAQGLRIKAPSFREAAHRDALTRTFALLDQGKAEAWAARLR
jgi:hypothetical protein